MGYVTSPKFWDRYENLPPAAQRAAAKAFKLWQANPRHGSLQFKKVKPSLFSLRLNREYRALGSVEGHQINWFWLGPHDEYEQIIRRW